MADNFNKLSMKGFLDNLKGRSARLAAGSPTPPPATDTSREIARALHPGVQYATVSSVADLPDGAKAYELVPDKIRGTEAFAFAPAGKYLTVFAEINGMTVTRPYSIASSPADSCRNKYMIAIKPVEGGFVSNYIIDTWKEGTAVKISDPTGNFDYQPLRDAQKVIGIAGGSGITPFLSFANAIADGDEDFELTLLYGSRNEKAELFREELDALAEKTEKFRIVHVYSDDDVPESDGYEKGFVTADLIKKYAPEGEPYSLFICGPQAMYNFVDEEIKKLDLPRKYVRHELFGEPHNASSIRNYPEGDFPATVCITVHIQDKTYSVTGNINDTIMQSIEKSGIAVPARCRSGECGFCHSIVLAGKYWIPENLDFRRLADEPFGGVHPCVTFPLSDIEIDVPAAK
ncbi:MAG: iron-sulfur cluster-binding domain-containing protein [Clostridia bacterium]|nr:iron-sulfur cluster-binding domain-containing protein [Clostridia bacterium]